MRRTAAHLLLPVLALTALAACGSDDDTSSSAADATAAAAVPAGEVQLISATEAKALLDAPPAGLVILDVRTPEEFASGHIEGATVLDFNSSTFVDDLSKLDRGVPYFVYCHSGNRSGKATQAMQQLGFTTVYNLDGGVTAWQAAGYPLIS